jgi:hypothetical protein
MTFGISDMFTEILRYCWRERRAMVKFGAIPYIVVAATTLLAPQLTKESPAADWAFMVLLIVLQTVAYLPMAVAWYRMVVLGRDEVSHRPVFTLGRREGRFLFWQLAVVVVGLLIGAAGVGVIALVYIALINLSQLIAVIVCIVLSIAGLVGWLAMFNRLGLVMVMAATDQPASFGAAWTLTRGMTGALLGTLGLIVLAGLVAGFASQLVAFVFPVPMDTVLKALLGSGVSLAMFLATPTLFGMAYVRIMKAQAAAELNAAETPA